MVGHLNQKISQAFIAFMLVMAIPTFFFMGFGHEVYGWGWMSLCLTVSGSVFARGIGSQKKIESATSESAKPILGTLYFASSALFLSLCGFFLHIWLSPKPELPGYALFLFISFTFVVAVLSGLAGYSRFKPNSLAPSLGSTLIFSLAGCFFIFVSGLLINALVHPDPGKPMPGAILLFLSLFGFLMSSGSFYAAYKRMKPDPV